MFEVFDHTADLGLRMEAESFEELLVESGRALFTVICGSLANIEPRLTRELRVDGREPDFLLRDWLAELLSCFETERLLFVEFEVRHDPDGIVGSARGDIWDPARHPLEHEVKAVTYHGLSVRCAEHRWLGEVILDI